MLKHLTLRLCYDVTGDSDNKKTQDKSVFQIFLCHMTKVLCKKTGVRDRTIPPAQKKVKIIIINKNHPKNFVSKIDFCTYFYFNWMAKIWYTNVQICSPHPQKIVAHTPSLGRHLSLVHHLACAMILSVIKLKSNKI